MIPPPCGAVRCGMVRHDTTCVCVCVCVHLDYALWGCEIPTTNACGVCVVVTCSSTYIYIHTYIEIFCHPGTTNRIHIHTNPSNSE